MKTAVDERRGYRELAKRNVQLERSVAAVELPRLQSTLQWLGPVTVRLRFFVDDGRPWVAGSASAKCEMTCSGCAESLMSELNTSFKLCVTEDDGEASELGATCDVLLTSSEHLTLADIVEDELLLCLPSRLCERSPCDHQPRLGFPENMGDASANPFARLAELKDGID